MILGAEPSCLNVASQRFSVAFEGANGAQHGVRYGRNVNWFEKGEEKQMKRSIIAMIGILTFLWNRLERFLGRDCHRQLWSLGN